MCSDGKGSVVVEREYYGIVVQSPKNGGAMWDYRIASPCRLVSATTFVSSNFDFLCLNAILIDSSLI